MSASERLIGKAHDYGVLAASHAEREALVGGGSTSLLRLRSPSPLSSCVRSLPRPEIRGQADAMGAPGDTSRGRRV
jgi:hypothetical protein